MKIASRFRAVAWCLALPLSVAPAVASTLNEAYTLTYLSGPGHVATATQCLVFTNNGSIVGFPNSGTWNSTTYTYNGNFVVDGTDVRFYGTDKYSNVYTHHGKFAAVIRGGFDDFEPGNPGATAQNDGDIKLVPGCAKSVRYGSPSGRSATH